MMDLLVALIVMALIASLALPFVKAGAHVQLRSKAEEIASVLRSARAAALLSGRPSDVTIDYDRRVLHSRNPVDSVTIPQSLMMAVYPTSLNAFAFTADGHSSGGKLVLGAGSQKLAVSVDPFSSSVDVASP